MKRLTKIVFLILIATIDIVKSQQNCLENQFFDYGFGTCVDCDVECATCSDEGCINFCFDTCATCNLQGCKTCGADSHRILLMDNWGIN